MANRTPSILIGLAIAALFSSVNGVAAEQRWHALEAYTVEYEMSGAQSGRSIWRSRNWGLEQVQENDYAMKMAGMSIPTKNRVVTKGGEIITIDMLNHTATRTKNPLFDAIVTEMEDQDPVEFGRKMMAALGHVETDETKSVAGENCTIWRNNQLAQEVCFTEDGLTLWSDSKLMGTSITQTATHVDRNDGGPDSAYQVPSDIQVTEGPDLDAIRKLMRGGKIPSQYAEPADPTAVPPD